MPFGSYQGSLDRGVRKRQSNGEATGVMPVKLEANASQLPLIMNWPMRRSRDSPPGPAAAKCRAAGDVPISGPHGSRSPRDRRTCGPNGWRGRRGHPARSGSAGSFPPAVVDAVGVPVTGGGAGPACDGHVFVTHDGPGLTERTPAFVPRLGDSWPNR